MSLQEFGIDLVETVNGAATAEKTSAEEKFVEHAFTLLGEADEFDDPTQCYFKKNDVKVNAFDLRDDDTTLDLFIADYSSVEPCREMVTSDVQRSVKMARRFFDAARTGALQVGPANEVGELVRTIQQVKTIQHVRLVLLTNGHVAKLKPVTEKVDGVTFTRTVWDLERFQQLTEEENIDVEFKNDTGSAGIPCVRLPRENGVYESYLAIVPGNFLCDLYAEYGQRVLEANVRSYLQARGKVNKGIIETIRGEPQMFFAYNNGITATAEDLVVNPADGTLLLSKCRNLQIVNGGQTTASLHYAKTRGISLDGIFVPMKISVILDPERHGQTVVQLISRYANSQNKVNLSDLGSNSEFHRVLERLSRSMTPPSTTSGWFYERARGQYQNELARRISGKDKNAFRQQYPSQQCIPKTALAKYVMTWARMPHVVSLGGEKSFARFTAFLEEQKVGVPGESWFVELVATAILFRTCDRVVRETEIPGYKANIVTYTLALLSHLHGNRIRLDGIWKNQTVPEDAVAWMRAAVPLVRDHIVKTPKPGMNVTEWCKKEECWTSLRDQPPSLPWTSA